MNARMLVSLQIIRGSLGRRVFLATLALLAVGCLKAEGVYQKTKDGKTMVWNNEPKPGDTATWVGDRNRERYANGFGTLTWYTASGKIFARYYGNMVDGKFDGPVNAHSNGRVAHATFAEGSRVSPWAGGAATLRGGFAERKSTPAPTPPPEAEKPEKRDVVAESKKEPREAIAETPKKEVPPPPPPPPKPEATPKPKPKPTATPEIKRAAAKASPPPPAPSERPSPELFPTPAAAPTATHGVDESLRSLVGPPSSLHNTHPTERNTNGPLTQKEAVDLANTVARTHGYDPSNYAEPKVEHNGSDETWSLSYDAKDSDSGTEAKHLSITVDGTTKRATIAPPEEHKESP
jgi:outer membrane biosynthesis protein TonB